MASIVGMVLIGVVGLACLSACVWIVVGAGFVAAALLVVLFLKCQANGVARCAFFEGLEVLVQIYVAVRAVIAS